MVEGIISTYGEGLHGFSWHLIHSDWLVIKTPTGGRLLDWFGPICCIFGYIVFFCFGVGRDAVEMYKLWGRKAGLQRYFPKLLAPKRNGTVSKITSMATWHSSEATKASLLRNSSIPKSPSGSL
jgi:hypothetical protein